MELISGETRARDGSMVVSEQPAKFHFLLWVVGVGALISFSLSFEMKYRGVITFCVLGAERSPSCHQGFTRVALISSSPLLLSL